MNSLESPLLEALAFDYLSCSLATLVNNVWTWVAILTAAISFWRIRSSSPTALRLLKSAPVCQEAGGFSAPLSTAEKLLDEATETREPPEPAAISGGSVTLLATASCCAEEREGRTKGKFTVCYYNDGDEVEMKDENEADGDGEVAVEWRRRWCCYRSCERVLSDRMRMRDEMGWYRCQDLAVLDGNVVRLWDGRQW